VHCFEDCPNVITIPSIRNSLCIGHKHRIISVTFLSEGLLKNEKTTAYIHCTDKLIPKIG
jgi:hypothetical protein